MDASKQINHNQQMRLFENCFENCLIENCLSTISHLLRWLMAAERLKDATVKTVRTILSHMFKGPLTDSWERSCSLFRETLGALAVSLKC